MSTTLRILLLIDRDADVDEVLLVLHNAGFTTQPIRVFTEHDFLAQLTPNVDVILSDRLSAKFDIQSTLNLLQERKLDIPLILIIDPTYETHAIECVKNGAADYLYKDRLGRLPVAVARATANATLRREKSQLEASLRKTETLYHVISEDQFELVTRFRPDGTFTYVNDAYCQYMGKTREALIGWNYMSSVPEAEREDLAKYYASFSPENPTGRYEHSLKMPDGEIRWRHWTDRAFFDDQGNLVEIQAVGHDITDRKKIEHALENERNLLQLILDTAPDLIYVTDIEHRFVLANKATQAFLGVATQEEAVGKTDFDFSAPEVAIEFYADDTKVLETGKSLINKVELNIDRFGTRKWMLTTKVPLRDNSGNITGLLGVTRDISERKEVEDVLYKTTVELSLLNEAGRLLSHTLDLTVVYDTLHNLIRRTMDCDDLYISSYTPEDNLIRCTYARHNGKSLDAAQFPPIPLEPDGFGTQSVVIRTGNSLLISDYVSQLKKIRTSYLVDEQGIREDDSALDENVERTRSALIVPIKLGNRVLGVVQVLSNRLDAFTSDHLRLLEALVAQAAAASVNAYLYQQAQTEIAERKNAESSEREQRLLAEALRNTAAALVSSLEPDVVMTRVLESIGRVVPNDSATIMLLEGDQVRTAYWYGYPPHMAALLQDFVIGVDQLPNLRQMIETGQPYLSPDTATDPAWTVIELDSGKFNTQLRSYVGAPIQIQGKVFGFLNVDSHTAGFFTEAHRNILQVFADQAAVAIRNAQLYDELRRYTDELEKRVEQRTVELREALEKEKELNELKSGIIYTVTHEFRNPLAIILATADILKKYSGGYTEEQKQERIERIRQEVKRLERMVQDMLFVGKAEAGKQEFNPVPLDLEVLSRTIIEEVLISINSTHEIVFLPEGDSSGLMIDERLVRYAVNNLLHNAAKYSPPGSVIHFDLMCGAENIVIRIRDHGIGIPDEDQKRLFQSFYRARNVGKISGTGLGLVIVRHAIRRHGGDVTLESQEGTGTTVTVTLPVTRSI